MPCGVQHAQTVPFWSPPGKAPKALDAYIAAQTRLREVAARWAARFREQLTCPDGCKNPHGFHFSVEELKLDGHQDFRTGRYVIQIKARLYAQWVCDPVHGEQPTPPMDPLPGDDLTGTAPPTTPAVPPIGPPCVPTLHDHDQSWASTPGVFDWNLDLTFQAVPGEPNHHFNPGSCRVTDIWIARAPTGNALADMILGGLGESLGQTYHLMDQTKYGLKIESGAGQASVSGTLYRDKTGLPLDASWAPVLYVTVHAVDSNGDPVTKTFGPYSPH